jgi:hypothetical protein
MAFAFSPTMALTMIEFSGAEEILAENSLMTELCIAAEFVYSIEQTSPETTERSKVGAQLTEKLGKRFQQ